MLPRRARCTAASRPRRRRGRRGPLGSEKTWRTAWLSPSDAPTTVWEAGASCASHRRPRGPHADPRRGLVRRVATLAIAFCLAQAAVAHAQAAAPETQAVRASGPIHLDGRLDEPAWQAAPPITSFIQLDPHEGQPASESSEVRLLYDDAAIYVGARLSGLVRYRLGRRDMDLLDSDWFGVALDSYHDHRTAFHFQVNPGAVQRDATMRMESGQVVEDNSWDPVWEVATLRDSAGWTAEVRIPFSQLRFRAS